MSAPSIVCGVCGRQFPATEAACPNCHTPAPPAGITPQQQQPTPAGVPGGIMACTTCGQPYNSALPNCPNCNSPTPGHLRPPSATTGAVTAGPSHICTRCGSDYASIDDHCPNCGAMNPIPISIREALARGEAIEPTTPGADYPLDSLMKGGGSDGLGSWLEAMNNYRLYAFIAVVVIAIIVMAIAARG